MRTRPILAPTRTDPGILRYLDVFPLWPLYSVAIILGLSSVWQEPSEWRLMAVAFAAFAFNLATMLLVWRRWRGAVAVFGLGLNSILQAFFLGTICVPGLMGKLSFFQPFDVIIGSEMRAGLMLVLVPAVCLVVLLAREFLTKDALPGAGGMKAIAEDPALPTLLIFSAVFSLLFWAGSFMEFGLVKAATQTLQRAFIVVPFLAGLCFRISPMATSVWLGSLALNLALGVLTGSRAPAFLPAILYAIGVFFGCSSRQRIIYLLILPVVAVPSAYVFGMIEVIRSDVGRLRIGELTGARIGQVSERMSESGVGDSNDPYADLPAWVRTNVRVVTWPTLVVAVAANERRYRGFDDLPEQAVASLNIVALSGKISGYYNEGLFNLRASDYGFTVNEGTSVEFGMLAESWDRGGPWAAAAYSLVAVLILGAVEGLSRRILRNHPALCAITVCVIFGTAFWTLNIYNLMLSLRHMVVNLFFCFVVFGAVNAFAPKRNQREGTLKALPERRSGFGGARTK